MPRFDELRCIIESVVIAIAVVIAFIVVFLTLPSQKSKVYDCSISEISPDYPLDVKEECRKLRAKNFQEELKKPK